MNEDAALTLSQARYVNKAFWRNPARAFFTFAFPLMFLVIFTSLLGNGTVHIGALAVKESTYYVAAMAAFGVITACFNNTAISMTFGRDAGILKRINGTPLPRAVFFASRILHAMLVALLLVVITAAFGHIAYSAHMPSGRHATPLPRDAARRRRRVLRARSRDHGSDPERRRRRPDRQHRDPAAAVPLRDLHPLRQQHPGMDPLGRADLPVRHFADGLQAGYLGTPFHWSDVAVVAGWGIAGLLLSIRFFSWEPRR